MSGAENVAETHKIMGGNVNLYRRKEGGNWQCSTFLSQRSKLARHHEEDSLARAKDFAEDWYLGMRGKVHSGALLDKDTKRHGKKFKEAAAKFLGEAPILTQVSVVRDG